jgi:hypothetical protein
MVTKAQQKPSSYTLVKMNLQHSTIMWSKFTHNSLKKIHTHFSTSKYSLLNQNVKWYGSACSCTRQQYVSFYRHDFKIKVILNYLLIIWGYLSNNQWEQIICMWNKSWLQLSCRYHIQIYLYDLFLLIVG